jgi:DME family drug/metabolite transporter
MKAFLAVLAAALCFSTTGTARALAGVDASPVAVGAARILFGGGLLGLIALLSRGRDRQTPRRPTGRDAVLVAVGACGVLAYQPTFFLGTQLNGVAVGTVVALGSAPVVTGALDSLWQRRLPTRRWTIATGLAIAGVVLVSGLSDPAQVGAVRPLGILASLGAGASYAVYTLASKALLARSWSPTSAMGAVFGSAAVLSIPVLLLAGTAWLATPAGLSLALWLGVVTTTVAYLLFGWGLSRISATTASTVTLAEPVAAALLGIVVLGERLTPTSVVGMFVIATGLVLLAIPTRGRADVPTSA